MFRMRLLLAVASTILFCAPALRAEEPKGGQAAEATLEVLIESIRSNRKALVAANLALTDAEAVNFWPVYERYQGEINAIGNRLIAILEDYSTNFRTLTDEQATKVVGDYLTVEADRVKVKRNFVPEFTKILPGRKVARLYQIENKMDAVLRYDMASTIPVIDEEAAPPPKADTP